MPPYPTAQSVPRGENKDKIVAQARRTFSGSLANNTKWNELIAYMRGKDGWRPSYRSKWVTGHISDWDAEWLYHLPLPFVGVAWLDIGLHEPGETRYAPRLDHTESISRKLAEIGFEFEVRGDVARIWGYAPKCYEDFPPAG
ncbi:hypothetical protein G3N92_12115 [Burkholderia sp. Ac-20379]|nr:hypothetical protein [Burkholderia sp. Ac-20379]